ncbi:crotonobetainyl-CoA:carnitine CoA-transferase CaiB-like acyl-CoA transferase [Arthrobacter sp. MP_M7]|nr:crotonobetainyl-CoA:carnitine CoA-transferase CaiB-like acyl-CoA transferase [Arthrobacter sp. MP_M4]MEC5203832.1 crotonobetainyl-CoA:carnitine CoA-transferase CaiB-like acyl-CoA transferase [Arthrobacter sp. MP_M7]
MEGKGLLNASVHTLGQALADAQKEANGMIVEAEHPGVGTVRMLNAPIRLSANPPTVRRVAPRLGEHNAEVLLENGFDTATIERLQQLGVLR